jgi:hypothetical protein
MNLRQGECEAPLLPDYQNLLDVAFDSAGNLFEADWSSGNIYQFTPGGVRKHLCLRIN